MTPDQWQQGKGIVSVRPGTAPEERHAFLVDACQGDDRLRREVSSLLKFDDRADAFIETPATAVVPELFTPEPSKFVGRRIGPYRY